MSCENEKTDDVEKGDEMSSWCPRDEVRRSSTRLLLAGRKKGARPDQGRLKRQSQSYIGFSTRRTERTMRLDWQNTSNIVKALTDLDP